jgi:hypothetical protein
MSCKALAPILAHAHLLFSIDFINFYNLLFMAFLMNEILFLIILESLAVDS